MAEETTVFRAIDYMVELCQTTMTALGLEDAYVYDGPPTGDAAERIQVLVAYNDEEGSPAIDGTAGTSNFGAPVESYTIDCSISIADGDADLKAKRLEARTLFNSLVGAVRNDRSLGGLITPPGIAEISGFVYSQDHDNENSYVVAAFSVEIREAGIWYG